MPPGVAYDLVEGTVPGSGAMLQLAAAASAGVVRRAAGHRRARVVLQRAAPTPASARPPGRAARPAAAAESGEQTAFWRPEQTAAPVLRFDDGMVVTVDEDLVLGRRPDNHELVASGSARAVPIADTQNVLSSAHAALQRSGREVSLVDLGLAQRHPRRRARGHRVDPARARRRRTRSPTATACCSAGPSSPSSSRRSSTPER